ncbi:MAG: energy-coupling factor transporter transmembrane component T [Microbacterium sp.]
MARSATTSSKTSNYLGIASPLTRLHPNTKVAGVFLLGIGSALAPLPFLPYAVLLVMFAAAIVGGFFRRYIALILAFAIPITIMLTFIHGLYSPKNRTVIADLGFAQLGSEGLVYAFDLIGVLLVFLSAFYIMTATTYPGKIATGMQQIGISPKISYLVLASLNVAPQIQRRISVIREAQESRGVETTGTALVRVRAFLPLLGPVIMGSLVDVQERGMALSTRAFGAQGVTATTFVQAPWHRRDSAWLVVFSAFFLVMAVWFAVALIRGGL